MLVGVDFLDCSFRSGSPMLHPYMKLLTIDSQTLVRPACFMEQLALDSIRRLQRVKFPCWKGEI